MPVLHLLNHTPRGSESFARCLESMAEGDGLLLIEDAVYAALSGTPSAGELRAVAAARNRCFVLKSDLESRALSVRRLAEGFECVDFAGFVDLVAKYDASISWG
ncbi:MAG: sulfurtransferase complex subunit TusB [Methylotetracoccus sp.]|nr:sulfurtransferase complex subunit TusB [Methylotetracoccus sp.]